MTPTLLRCSKHDSLVWEETPGACFAVERDDLKHDYNPVEDCDIERYELHPVGGLHVDRVPCDNCKGTGVFTYPDFDDPEAPKCRACGGSGMTWPAEVLRIMAGGFIMGPGQTAGENARDMLDALVAAQTGDTE